MCLPPVGSFFVFIASFSCFLGRFSFRSGSRTGARWPHINSSAAWVVFLLWIFRFFVLLVRLPLYPILAWRCFYCPASDFQCRSPHGALNVVPCSSFFCSLLFSVPCVGGNHKEEFIFYFCYFLCSGLALEPPDPMFEFF
jgi:hypothetical protein